MLPEEFHEELRKNGIVLTEEQMEKFAVYFERLVEWNQKMNLTAITEKSEVYLKHFYDSVSLAFETALDPQSHLCDVGSGAGFPSIPLKIVFPELEVTIVDSLNKRITFLQTLVTDLQLENVHLYHDRAETFGQNPQFRGQFDYVTARAVARLNVLTELCVPLVKKAGYFYALKAAKSEEELVEAKPAISLLGGKFIEEKSFTLPVSGDERHLLIIQKKKETPKKYPRKPGMPAKQPIK
ncbi:MULTISPECIES: 16S rRNA (guanine(527)-N(7))-methyltransferase RsmG [unclassified Enterococcus]|uniref:16S rRNA (guanine(527)-N(7))-methyltransferase RsmG n=1 Tax=unclassified Enterococcus TaxID=2608891 RepID=UPI0009BC9DA8|nr:MULTISPECIES: 16S rRNA (guanine(527)-N(7))-methyltransferase RsmG [unclassified Enterococcus]OQO88737.1 16S rRNA (guanine(527)-N(7))-methyltransferase [Enterococcus casseliflavus]MBK0037476.1 16S rRNA (guanine(527)-N(7))-methyltransferase RsmG [Enterococcus sp. S52]MBK0070139.1 16S rRNA (guanine(527)-N(7))-methyltransferase RsmG [Enterococcus sp. S53]MBK0140979.1 16S rRNA (guanine(527)-N(7))-methyltransferase RsmG [Enterococcus sp. S76]MBK0144367.1 16S rRNA (guanine(527)-N(7))-methyltransfe